MRVIQPASGFRAPANESKEFPDRWRSAREDVLAALRAQSRWTGARLLPYGRAPARSATLSSARDLTIRWRRPSVIGRLGTRIS
jgi:hypothetical protein